MKEFVEKFLRCIPSDFLRFHSIRPSGTYPNLLDLFLELNEFTSSRSFLFLLSYARNKTGIRTKTIQLTFIFRRYESDQIKCGFHTIFQV